MGQWVQQGNRKYDEYGLWCTRGGYIIAILNYDIFDSTYTYNK